MFYERSVIYITNKRTHSAGKRHFVLITLHGIVYLQLRGKLHIMVHQSQKVVKCFFLKLIVLVSNNYLLYQANVQPADGSNKNNQLKVYQPSQGGKKHNGINLLIGSLYQLIQLLPLLRNILITYLHAIEEPQFPPI